MSKLPINLHDLLRQRTVEGERIEYKAVWNPDAIIRTLCAFANDFENLGGGYVVIGQDCDANGQPVFPPVGLADNQLDKIQQELLAACQLIQPQYFPVLSIEEVEGRKLIEVSIGDYILSGGEMEALTLLDACMRLIPGVMGKVASGEDESFENGLLEYPHYTRPREWEGRGLPEALLSGDHARIAKWRRAEAERITRERRPDLFAKRDQG